MYLNKYGILEDPPYRNQVGILKLGKKFTLNRIQLISFQSMEIRCQKNFREIRAFGQKSEQKIMIFQHSIVKCIFDHFRPFQGFANCHCWSTFVRQLNWNFMTEQNPRLHVTDQIWSTNWLYYLDSDKVEWKVNLKNSDKTNTGPVDDMNVADSLFSCMAPSNVDI